LELLRKFRSWGFLDQDTEKKLVEVIFEFYERARRRRHSRKGQTLLREFNNALDEVWHELILETSKIMSEIGVDGIAQARESGLLEIYTFESLVERMLKAEDYEGFTWEYVNTVSAAVSDSHTYPLFDEDTGNIISAGIAAGKITVSTSGISRSREVATVKEILDIRRELDKPLRRFRAAIIGFSENIKHASWDQDFSVDAEQVFARDVAPEILNLEEAVKATSFLSNLTSHFAEKSFQLGGVVTGSIALSGLAMRMSNVPLVDVAALSIGPILAAGGIAYNSYRKWKSEQEIAEQNNLFFYYQAGRLLEQGKYQYVSDKL